MRGQRALRRAGGRGDAALELCALLWWRGAGRTSGLRKRAWGDVMPPRSRLQYRWPLPNSLPPSHRSIAPPLSGPILPRVRPFVPSLRPFHSPIHPYHRPPLSPLRLSAPPSVLSHNQCRALRCPTTSPPPPQQPNTSQPVSPLLRGPQLVLQRPRHGHTRQPPRRRVVDARRRPACATRRDTRNGSCASLCWEALLCRVGEVDGCGPMPQEGEEA